MFKYSATILLLLALFTQTFRQAAIVGGYYADNELYAKDCINKAKPQLHCNGKCQLMKKLKQEEKKDQQNPERRGNGKEEVLSSKSFFASVADLSSYSFLLFFDNKAYRIRDISFEIIHPPA